MESHERELLVARICSGSIRCRVLSSGGQPAVYLIKRPSRDQLYLAHEHYQEVLRDAQFDDLYDDDALYDFLLEQGAWDIQRQTLLEKLPKEIEEFKFQLWKTSFKSNEKQVIRRALGMAKTRLAELNEQRQAYAHLSCSGLATIARTRFIVGCALCHMDGRPVFTSESFFQDDGLLMERVMEVYMGSRLNDTQYRELARTEPWRSIWAARKVEGSIFGLPAADLTEDQRNLVSWTSLYDHIFQHPQCPPEEVLEDDDVLDGWMVAQKREKESQSGKASAESAISNDKIRNAQEIYIVAETLDDAKKVDSMNEEQAAAIKRQRFAAIRNAGDSPVNEMQFPDMKSRLRQEVTQKLLQQAGS